MQDAATTVSGDSRSRPSRASALRALAHAAAETDPPPLVVGGAVRDALLGRDVSDVDVVVFGDAHAVARSVAERTGTRVVTLGTRERVYRLPTATGQVDVVPAAGTLAVELGRRDFTINALAVPLGAVVDGFADLRTEDVVDLHGGLDDLRARRLELVRSDALQRDPVRALRAARFTAELGFDAGLATRRAMRAVSGALLSAAPERLSGVLLQIFDAPTTTDALTLLEETGLLEVVFPELAACRGVRGGGPHRADVLTHQLATVTWVDTLISRHPPANGPARVLWRGVWTESRFADAELGRIRDHLWANRGPLRLAGLLHDVGKPRTRSQDASGRIRYFGHADLGARMVRERLTELRFSGAVVDTVALLVAQHLRPGQIASPGQPPTPRALHRFHRTLGPAVPEACLLFLADSLATAGPEALVGRWPAYVAHVREIVQWRPAAAAEQIRRVVDGHTLMNELGLPPGPIVGRLLDAIETAAASSEVHTPIEAVALARDLLDQWGAPSDAEIASRDQC